MGKQTLSFGLETENYYSDFEGRAVESQGAKNKSILKVGFVLVVKTGTVRKGMHLDPLNNIDIWKM